MKSVPSLAWLIVAVFATFFTFQTVKAVHSMSGLVEATQQQCLNEDWPASQHEAHVAFCHDFMN